MFTVFRKHTSTECFMGLRVTVKRGPCPCISVMQADGVRPDEMPPPTPGVLNARHALVLIHSVIHRVGSEAKSSRQNHFPDLRALPPPGDPHLGFYADSVSASPHHFRFIAKMGHYCLCCAPRSEEPGRGCDMNSS